MNRVGIYSMLSLALFIHLVILNHVKIFGAKPDLVALSVIFFSLFSGKRLGFEVGLVAGFLEDVFALDIFWMNTFRLGITGLLVGALSTKFFKESKPMQILLVFTFTLLSMVIHYLSASFYTRGLKINLPEYFIYTMVPVSIYTTIISIPIFSKFISLYGLDETDEELL